MRGDIVEDDEFITYRLIAGDDYSKQLLPITNWPNLTTSPAMPAKEGGLFSPRHPINASAIPAIDVPLPPAEAGL